MNSSRVSILHGLLLASLLCVATFQAHAEPPKMVHVKPSTPEGFTLQTFTVAEHPEHTVELFVYMPDAGGPRPCILDIHGGGWKSRQVENDKPMMERLAQRGYVTALVSYRLSTEAPYPAALYDCKAAIRMLRAKAGELKIDPAHIGIIGGSAGGHLTGLVAMTSGLPEFEGDGPYPEQSSAVQAAVAMAGPQDLVTPNLERTNEGTKLFLGGDYQSRPELFKAASPITHVRPGVPPILFLEAELDSVKAGRAEMMEKLQALGIDTGIHTLKEAPHPFWMGQAWIDETVDQADAFFKKHLGKPAVE